MRVDRPPDHPDHPMTDRRPPDSGDPADPHPRGVTGDADPSDPRLDDFRGLSDAELRRRVEGGPGGLFVAEGELVVRRLLGSGIRVRSLLVSPRGLRRLADVVEGAPPFPVHVADQPVLDAVVGFHAHRGVFASAVRPDPVDPADLVRNGVGRGRPPALLAVAEDLTDHENLGALFRNAAGLGVDGVLLSPRCCDPLYRRSVRVSMGAVLTLPWARLPDTVGGLTTLAGAGWSVVGLTPDPGAPDIDAVAGRLGDRVAVVLGAEGPGLTPGARAACSHLARVPMSDAVDSLNVATAAAIAFHVLGPARRARAASVPGSGAGHAVDHPQ